MDLGCHENPLADHLLDAAYFGIAASLPKLAKQRHRFEEPWLEAWGLREREVSAFPRRLRQVAMEIENVNRSRVLSPFGWRSFPGLAAAAFDCWPLRSWERSERRLIVKVIQALPWLLKTYAAELEAAGTARRKLLSTPQIVRISADVEVFWLIKYVREATGRRRVSVPVSTALTAVVRMLCPRKAHLSPYTARALNSTYGRMKPKERRPPIP